MTDSQTSTLDNILTTYIDDYTDDLYLDMPLTTAGLDSLDRLELVMDIEKEFSTIISDDTIENISTFKDLKQVVADAIK